MDTIHSTHRLVAPASSVDTGRAHIAARLRSGNWKHMATEAKNKAGECIARYPALSLAAALSLGAIAGWFVKRK